MNDDYLWDPSAPPDPELQKLEAALRPAAHRHAPLPEQGWPSRTRHMRLVRWAAIAAGMVLVVGGLFAVRRSAVAPWTVVAERGVPVVRDAAGRAGGGALARGGVVETDGRSSAIIAVGRIGRAVLGSGSRLRLIGADSSEHRLFLERGTMHASVDAPPRYFLVQTPSALAVDLGCAYTLTVDERGNGSLTVEEGEVELELGQVRVAVLAGNTASLRTGRGPGLPHPVRASAALRRAVAAYDADPSSGAALDSVLAAADSSSTITLWHLLQSAEPAQRERVFARLAAIAPPPASATRERIVRGESGALQRWRTDLQSTWAVEAPVWRRVWLALNR